MTNKDIYEKMFLTGSKLLDHDIPEEVYKIITTEAKDLFNGDSCSIFLNEIDELYLLYDTQELLEERTIKIPHFLTNRLKNPQIFSTKTNNYSLFYSQKSNSNQGSTLYIPLFSHKTVLALLIVFSSQTEQFENFLEEEINMFSLIVSLAFEKTTHYQELQDATDMRDSFISMAAHELRTPLTAVSGYVQLLHSKLADKQTSEARWVEHLLWESKRLGNLIQEMLEVNKIRTGRYHYDWQECSLRYIVQKSLSDKSYAYPDRQIIIQDQIKEEEDLLIADGEKIMQVIRSIIDNSVKFSDPQTTITITLSSANDHFILQIKDQGIGIQKKDLPKIFKGFQRGSNHKREGMGFGLFLVKDVISHHHGNLEIKSVPNKGTTVSISLPKMEKE